MLTTVFNRWTCLLFPYDGSMEIVWGNGYQLNHLDIPLQFELRQVQSHDAFRPIVCEQKYLMDYSDWYCWLQMFLHFVFVGMSSRSYVKEKRLYMPEDGLILSEIAVLSGYKLFFIKHERQLFNQTSKCWEEITK